MDVYQKNAKIAQQQVSVQIVVGKSVAVGIVLITNRKLLARVPLPCESIFAYLFITFHSMVTIIVFA